MLLEKGANANAKGGRYGATALLAAVNQGKARVVKLLIDHGADVNAGNTINHAVWTPLKLAEERRLKQIVRMLQRAGAWQCGCRQGVIGSNPEL